MISVAALFRLLKIGINDRGTLSKVHRIFVPQEHTKVDGIIDLVFETAEAAREDLSERVEESFEPGADSVLESSEGLGDSVRYASRVGSEVKAACLRRVEEKLSISLTPRSNSFFVDGKSSTGVMCAVSSRYRGDRYWFAFHERHERLLEESTNAYVVLGCGSSDAIVCLEYSWFKPYLSSLNASKSTPVYHHIHIDHEGAHWTMKLKGRDNSVDVTRFL